MKKAQSISINTIIVAAIALVVLVVIVMIFTGRLTLFGKDLDAIQQGNKCDVGDGVREWKIECSDDETQVYGVFSDKQEGRVCCAEIPPAGG